MSIAQKPAGNVKFGHPAVDILRSMCRQSRLQTKREKNMVVIDCVMAVAVAAVLATWQLGAQRAAAKGFLG
jgi:hypothetical protein